MEAKSKKWLIRFTRGAWVIFEAPTREQAEKKAGELARAWHYPSYEVVEYEG